MFYVCGKRGNKLLVMDTEDGVSSAFTEAEIGKVAMLGFRVIPHKDMEEIVYFIWSYCVNMNDFGLGEFEDVLDYCTGRTSNPYGGSRGDYAERLKGNYEDAKKLGFDADIYSIWDSEDLLVKDLYELYFAMREDRKNKVILKRSRKVAAVCDKWGLDYETTFKLYH